MGGQWKKSLKASWRRRYLSCEQGRNPGRQNCQCKVPESGKSLEGLGAAAEDSVGGEAEGLGHKGSWPGVYSRHRGKLSTRMWTLDGKEGPGLWPLWPSHHLQAVPSSVLPLWAASGASPAWSLPPLSGQGQWAGPQPGSLGAGAQAGRGREKGEAEEAGRKRGA